MIILIDTENTLEKIEHSFTISKKKNNHKPQTNKQKTLSTIQGLEGDLVTWERDAVKSWQLTQHL